MLVMIGTFFVSGHAFSENENNLKSNNATTPNTDPAPASRAPEPRIPNGLKKHSIGIGIGQTFLVGEFEDLGENKITWDLLYSYSASHSYDLLMNFHHEKYRIQFNRIKKI